jgi:hypothetical protein
MHPISNAVWTEVQAELHDGMLFNINGFAHLRGWLLRVNLPVDCVWPDTIQQSKGLNRLWSLQNLPQLGGEHFDAKRLLHQNHAKSEDAFPGK